MIEEEERKPPEEAGPPEEQVAAKRRAKRNKLIAVIVAVAVAGVGIWWFVFSNNPPNAAFTYSSVDLRLSVNAGSSTDLDGNIASYIWDWGDGTQGSGVTQVHDYAQTRDYTVTLTVTDTRGATGTAQQIVAIRFSPTASFIARHDRMTVSFDASTSSPSAQSQSPIASYAWDFGDGSTGTGVTATHSYATPGRYFVNLTVTDQAGAKGTATRFASPADTTVDLLLDQFFSAGCPFNEYWELRYLTYGDLILQNSYPCTDYYPWVLYTDSPTVNPSYVYTLYRWDARVRNHPGYDLIDPVMFPVLNPAVQPDPNSYVDFDLSLEYLNSSDLDYWSNDGWFPVSSGFSDGFGFLVRGNITMDLTMSRRIFGVEATTAAEARTWWQTHTTPGGVNTGVEAQYGFWLEDLGNGRDDIYNAFEWYYQPDISDLNATVADDGTTRVAIFVDGYGFDVLIGRWFYWGKANYRDAVCVRDPDNPLDPCPQTLPYGAIQPQGWMPMESCWCEHAVINGTIRSSLDLDFTAIQGYSFGAWANWGQDGFPDTSDDLPAWVWQPVLMDYVPRSGGPSPAASGFPNSELRWYEGLRSVHGSPGSFAYGDAYEYLVPPARWAFNAGSTLTLVMPRGDIVWYDPIQSRWDETTLVGDYVTFDAPLTLRLVRPGGDYFIWDPKAKVISMAGPHDWGETGLPLSASPWIEFGPETTA